MSGDADSSRDGVDTSRGDPQLIGRVVSGKYKIEKFLGGGAMGAVYKARFQALEKYVAVKVMHSAIAVDPNFVARFHREAKAASRLDHPNSMRVIDFGAEPDGLLYIAMEYAEGRDLYRVIHEDWPISNADIGDILMQALAAIAVAHEMGVIHRDLKPENLMILRQKNDEERDAYLVKVCDFGIAKITERDDEPKPPEGAPGGQKLTTQGLVVGTPEYMSPEQAKGEKLDARSDIYSIGVILYQLITGRTPFTGDTALSIVLKHITEAPAAPSVHYPGVHKGLEAIALRAMAKDKNERFQTARAMRNAIRETLEGRPIPAFDPAAATALDMAVSTGMTGAPSTGPTAIAPGHGVTAPLAAVAGSHPTPLVTAAAAAEPKKSRAGLIIGVAAMALVAGGAAAATVVRENNKGAAHGGGPAPEISSSGAVVVATTTTARTPSSATTTAAPATAATAPVPVSTDAKAGKRNAAAHGATGAGAAKVTAEPHGTATAAPVETAAPPPPPPPPPEPPPPATTTAAAPPPPPAAPAFNAQTCKAVLGMPRSNGAVNSKDLALNGTAGAWTGCAQRSFHEKPGAGVSASVHLTFSDNRAFRGASCASCPPALSQCIASVTARTVAVNIRGGDISGEPAFDVPVTFTCE